MPFPLRTPHLGLACLAAIMVSLAPVYAEAAEIVHVVGKGQTLGRIAKRYHVSVEAIREANNLKPGERIHPGLSLVIPEKGKEAEAARKAAQLAALHARGLRPDKPGYAPEPPLAHDAKKGRKGKDRDADDRGDAPRGPHKKGFVHLARGSDHADVQFLTRRGKLAPPALAALRKLLRFYPTGSEIAIDPRLAALIGQVSDHFGGRTIKVVSGFRPYSPAQYTPHSNHNVGRAMDFSIEGIPNTAVRDFCRTFRNAGVGYYPNSSFVHLDVRTGKTYWIDYSHPGEAPHYDSPSSQSAADESARDVEPHAGAGDGSPEAERSDPGSNDTR